jgi:catechol 2,3-dioxygenase-like lactoylglutathione lyase family enzyme
MSNIIKRTTLIVRDVQKSVEWYQKVLGMTIYFDTEVVLSPGTSMAAGKPGDRTHLVIMQCEHPEIGMIGLLQWVDPPLPAPDEIPTRVTYGNPTFVCASDDSRAAFEQAHALGTHVHTAPHEWSIRGANGMIKNFIGVSLFDPDGYFYELNQLVSETPPE